MLAQTSLHGGNAKPELLRRRIDLESYDEQPLPAVDSEAIAFAAASECFSEHRTLRRQDLRTLGLAVDHQGRSVPTIGGMILFGTDRLTHVPDAREYHEDWVAPFEDLQRVITPGHATWTRAALIVAGLSSAGI